MRLSLTSRCSKVNGGAKRDRTADLLRARQALSQLSYSPNFVQKLVGLGGFEPPTSPLSGVRSNQLSYRPNSIATGLSSPVGIPYFTVTINNQTMRVDTY